MTEVLLAVVVALLLCVLVFLVVLAKRRGEGGTQAEQQLRAQVAGLEALAAELRTQIAAREGEAEQLRRQLQAEHGARQAAEARLDAERKSFQEQRAILDEAREKLKDAFAALSAAALKDSREQFLSHAEERLGPIRDLLARYEQRLADVEKARSDAYGGLKERLDALAQAQQVFQKEAHQLQTALRSPAVRGRWGEMTLRRVVEVAGMSSHCDFQEQVSVAGEDGAFRPDMLVNLPGGRTIVVDSKVPLAAYLDAVEAPDQEARQAALARHAQDVRKHVRALAQKSYWEQFRNAAEFVVLFLPGESFFSAALEQDRTLMEDAMRSRVFLATPTTLMALLHIVAHGWRQQEMAESAEKIGEAGRELYERLAKFVEHFAGIGDGLRRAARAYDAAVGSYESRIQPAARRLAERAALGDKTLPEVERAEGPARLPPPGDGDAAGGPA